MTATTTSVPGDRAPSLERDAIGLPEVLFQSITHMAPAVATALSIGAATGFAGGLTPLAVLFAMIACLFTAYSIGQLAFEQEKLQTFTQDTVRQYSAQMSAERQKLQQEVDSLKEYERVQAQCRGRR